MEYTKGEWRRFGGMVDGYGIVSSSGEVIIEQQALSGLENEANAHLIASAPDLYEACRHAKIVLARKLDDSYLNQQEELLYIELGKALAKAEGK